MKTSMRITQSMKKLDRLNVLLKPLDLPSHKKSVANSGANLDWLRKNAAKRNEVSEELGELLLLPIGRLVNEDAECPVEVEIE
jgi:hypothetical protein